MTKDAFIVELRQMDAAGTADPTAAADPAALAARDDETILTSACRCPTAACQHWNRDLLALCLSLATDAAQVMAYLHATHCCACGVLGCPCEGFVTQSYLLGCMAPDHAAHPAPDDWEAALVVAQQHHAFHSSAAYAPRDCRS